MNNAALIEKIKKLLALTGSPNAHEAAQAAAKAQELLARHSLTRQQVEASDREEIKGACIFRGGRARAEHNYIFGILERFFYVRLIVVTGNPRPCSTHVFVMGREPHITVAGYLYDYLSWQFRGLWAEHRQAHKVKLKRQAAFYDGLRLGLYSKLLREENRLYNEHGLVPVHDHGVDAAFEAAHPSATYRKQKRRRASKDRTAGFRQGREIQIRPGVEAPAPGSTALQDSGAAALLALEAP